MRSRRRRPVKIVPRVPPADRISFYYDWGRPYTVEKHQEEGKTVYTLSPYAPFIRPPNAKEFSLIVLPLAAPPDSLLVQVQLWSQAFPPRVAPYLSSDTITLSIRDEKSGSRLLPMDLPPNSEVPRVDYEVIGDPVRITVALLNRIGDRQCVMTQFFISHFYKDVGPRRKMLISATLHQAYLDIDRKRKELHLSSEAVRAPEMPAR